MEQQESMSLFSLSIDPLSKSHLTEAAKWARFLAIIGMVVLVLMIIFGLFFSTMMAVSSNPFEEPVEGGSGLMSGFGVGMAILYIVLAAIWFFPLLYLLRFANSMRAALHGNDQNALNVSFQNLKSCFRYVGIITIILLVFYALIFTLAIVGSVGGMF